MTNEFDDMENDFPNNKNENEVQQDEEMQHAGGGAKIYNWREAPEFLKAPPRVDLDGQFVEIIKADILEPLSNQPWLLTRDGKKSYKNCRLVLYYSIGGQQEGYSGLKMFKQDVNGKEMLSHPSLDKNAQNQVATLIQAYAKFRKKDINMVSLREFMSFLNGGAKGRIQSMEFTNPQDKSKIKKNIIIEFVQ